MEIQAKPQISSNGKQQDLFRVPFALFALGLFILTIAGIFWLFSVDPSQAPWLIFAYATGLTMIVLPCTLPLAFIIVPLTIGKGYVRGFLIAITFALGVTLTLSLYGAFIAVIGKVVGLDQAKNVMFAIAGSFAFLLGLSEVGILNIRLPSYTGKIPDFIEKRQEYIRGFLLGLLMGNVGFGCPNPAFYVLLSYIATVGSLQTGWFLSFIHALGRITPLLLLAILGILGVNALPPLIQRRVVIEKAMGWGLIFVGAFIFASGAFTHDWYVYSGIHTVLEQITQEAVLLGILGQKFGIDVHAHEIPSTSWLPWAHAFFIFLLLAPLWLWLWGKKSEAAYSWIKAFVISVSALIIVLFGYVLPDRLFHAPHSEEEVKHLEELKHAKPSFYEEDEIVSGLVVNMTCAPSIIGDPMVREPKFLFMAQTLIECTFFVNEKPMGASIDDLDIIHEKPMHIIGVRNDLKEFFHVHPGRIGAGMYRVGYIFEKPGVYKIWSEIQLRGEKHIFGHPLLTIEGEGMRYDEQVFQDFSRTRTVGAYEVHISYPQRLRTNKDISFKLFVNDLQGNEVELEPFFGEAMHAVLVSKDLRYFHHLHAEGNDEHGHSLIPSVYANGLGTHGTKFTIKFQEKGLYRLFVQFRPKEGGLGKEEALTTSFLLEVQ